MRLIRFPTIPDATGTLTVMEALPFEVQRVFTLHGTGRRDGHAHRELEEVVVAVSGSFDVVTVNAAGRHRWTLNRPDRGLFIEPPVWRHLENFSANATALVLCSAPYDEADYIRDFGEFLGALPQMEEDWFSKGRWQEVEGWRKQP
jgi:hypothetical protein